jgi:hypothetical protein
MVGIVAACADDGPLVGDRADDHADDRAPVTAVPVDPPSTAPPATPSTEADEPTASPDVTSPGDPEPTAPPDATAPAGEDGGASADPAVPGPPLTNADGEHERYSGIGRLDGFGSSCSAFLLDVGTPSGPAYAMTNGHCVGIFDAVTVVRDAPAEDATVTFRLFADTPTAVAEVPVATVRYGTMRGTDVAVLELATTRSAVIGLQPYTLGSPPREGDAVQAVGIPVTGIPAEEWFLRERECTAGATTRLVEFEWVWDEAIATDCTGIVGGSSGSPVFSGSLPVVHAIVNTTTIGAPDGVTCTLGQPCEVRPSGTTMVPNRTYAMPVDDWGACFVPEWDPDAPGCPTEPEAVTVDAPLRAVQPGATWAATIEGGGDDPVVVKAGPIAVTDCRDAGGYELSGTAVDTPVGEAEGVYVLCATTLDERLQPDTRRAGSAVMVVDATPPDAPIELSVVEADGTVRVEPIFAPPEYSFFELKFGPVGEVDCADPAGYAVYRRIPVVVEALPATMCVIGDDDAGNRGAPQAFTIG